MSARVFVRSVFRILLFIANFLVVLFCASCANIGSPSGGAYDLDPPKLLAISIGQNATDVRNVKSIKMLFDENVQLDNPSEKVIITPPQRIAPVFTTINRRVKVDLRDSLIPNTTYVLDFTDALADMNEKNVLENFVVTFSTGDHIDSLEISGTVLDASDLEPVTGIFVGLHADLSDSAFIKKPFDRISKTDSKGHFTIRGVKSQKYRIYALKDANRDYEYSSPSEAIAFLDTIVEPSSQAASRVDTIFKKNPAGKKVVDSLVQKSFTHFIPDDIVLRSFTSDFQRQFLQKYERPRRNNLVFNFGSHTRRPNLEILHHPVNPSFPVLEERGQFNDTIKYWLTDPQVLADDSLTLKLNYIKTDSLNIGRETTDTLKIFFREFKSGKKKPSGKDKKEEIKFLGVKTNASGSININDHIDIEFEEPIKDFDAKKLVLEHKKDSTWKQEDYTLLADSLNPRKYKISHKWIPGDEYRLSADSASFFSYYGLWNNKLEEKFKIKNEDEYGLLFLNIKNLPANVPAFVELLDKSDKPIRRSKVKEGGVLFKYLLPGTYYARLVLDTNDNGVWDVGDFGKRREPEMVYYCSKSFNIKANWDDEDEIWDITALPLTKQKPLEITKNKPQEKKTKRQQLEEQEQKKQNSKKQTNSTTSVFNSTTAQ